MPTRLALMRDQVRYQPGSADAVFELAYEYFRLRNYNDAAIGFKRVLLTRPNDVEALNNYAVALYRTRRGDLARESLRRAGDLAAGHAVVQRNLGVVLDSQGRVADAVVAYAKAAKAAHEERKPKIESRASRAATASRGSRSSTTPRASTTSPTSSTGTTSRPRRTRPWGRPCCGGATSTASASSSGRRK